MNAWRAFFDWLSVTTTNVIRAISGEPTTPYVPPLIHQRGPYSPHEYVTVDEDGYFGVSCVVCKSWSWVAEMRDFESHILRRWYWSGVSWYCQRHRSGGIS